MCGIIGYVGSHSAAPILNRGLKLVEYRGYDSAGIGILQDGVIAIVKHAGDPEVTIKEVEARELTGTIGISHTRWATHGDITDGNAHPHTDCSGTIAVVHNGMLWNPEAIQEVLASQGHVFSSATDTENIAHLIERFRKEGDTLLTAVQKTAELIKEGAFAFVVLDASNPDELVGACMGGELYIGIADHGQFLVSDHRAFREHTEKCIMVEDGKVVVIRRDGSHQITTFDNEDVAHAVEDLYYEISEMEKAPYDYLMEREIYYQAEMIPCILKGRIDDDGMIRLGSVIRNRPFQEFVRSRMKNILFIACGTSKHAGDVLERFVHELGFDTRSLNAGEFATSPMRVDPSTLIIPISQSGTTAEVLRAATRAEKEGGVIWPLVNVPGSRLSRFGKGKAPDDIPRGMYTQAGLETAVASTKAFTAQIINGALFLYSLADLQQIVSPVQVHSFCTELRRLEGMVSQILEHGMEYQELGASIADAPLFFYIGKGYGMPVAEEGALKMREITYIPAFGISASDLKHGSIAMLDDRTTVIAICIPEPDYPEIYEWTLSNVAQVLSRKGRVVIVAEEEDERVAGLTYSGNAVKHVIRVPKVRGVLSTVTTVIPLQLLALGAAKKLGRPIDKPRNLAKSVTVV